MRRLVLSTAIVLGLGAIVVGCRAATQITIETRTDVTCASFKGLTITVGHLDEIENKEPSVIAGSDRCTTSGRIGSLVVTPSGDKNEEVAIRIVAGVKVPATECKPPKYGGCIVARRALRFIPHDGLELPVNLPIDCLDNPCEPHSTCIKNLGCVPATITDSDKCHGAGCDDPLFGNPSTPPSSVVRIGVGLAHACAVLANGTVRCWGSGEEGELGDRATIDRWTAVPVAGLGKKAIAVGVGKAFTCAVLEDASVACWGLNSSGELGKTPGSETPLEPNVVPGVTSVSEIVGGHQFACALRTDGQVQCWGDGTMGALGDGTAAGSIKPPRGVPGIVDAVQISAGYDHVCVRRASGKVTCWGNGLGTPTDFPGVTDAVTMAAGAQGLTAVASAKGGGSIQSLTSAGFGDPKTLPPTGPPIQQLGGYYDFYAVLADRSVVSFEGSPVVAKAVPTLGSGSTAELQGGSNFLFGLGFQCARLVAGGVRCWGGNYQGELGNDKPEVLRKAQKVAGLANVAKLRQRSGQFKTTTTAVKTDGSLSAWGSSVAFVQDYAASPATLAFAGTDVSDVWMGNDVERAYLKRKSGALAHVKDATVGAPGGGLESLGFVDFVDVFMSATFDAGLHSTGELEFLSLASDANTDGIFGQGNLTAVPKGATRKLVFPAAPLGVVATTDDFAIGNQTMCAWLTDGTVRCWGDNQVGLAGTTTKSEFVSAPNLIPFADPKPTITTMSIARYHACAVASDERVWCWGMNDHGALGSTRTDGPIPSLVPTITAAKGVTCFDYTSCAWLADKTAVCWGNNGLGGLGDGTLVDRTTPAPVLTASGPLTGVIGLSRSCALHDDGSVSCWGNSFSGQSGTGVSGVFATPQDVTGL